jgi:ribosomal protein S18 acetylase RimI-like enzyme
VSEREGARPGEPAAGSGTAAADGIRIEAVTEALMPTYRDVRIAALIDSPRAFWTTYPQAASRSDDDWADWLADGPQAWLAFAGDSPVGTVGLWRGHDQAPDEVTLIGMWVATVARGSGVAERLVRTALGTAADAGLRRVVLEVAHENSRAWAFYSRMGFRPTGETGWMPWDTSVTEERMVLDLLPPP